MTDPNAGDTSRSLGKECADRGSPCEEDNSFQQQLKGDLSREVCTTDARSRIFGRCLIILAAVLWSTSGFFVKSPVFASWPEENRGIALAWWRAVFASIVLCWFVRRPSISVRFAPMAICFVLMNWTYLSALVDAEASLIIWLQNTAPAWVFLGCWIFLREKGIAADWIMLGFCLVGLSIILGYQFSSSSTDPKSVVFGLLSGILYAGVVVHLRSFRGHDSFWLITLNHLAVVLCFFPIVFQDGFWPSGWQWLYLFGFGALQMGTPYVLFAMGLKKISGPEASALVLLEPILLPVWVWIAWRHLPDYQIPAFATMIGAGCILVGFATRYCFERVSRK